MGQGAWPRNVLLGGSWWGILYGGEEGVVRNMGRDYGGIGGRLGCAAWGRWMERGDLGRITE